MVTHQNSNAKTAEWRSYSDFAIRSNTPTRTRKKRAGVDRVSAKIWKFELERNLAYQPLQCTNSWLGATLRRATWK